MADILNQIVAVKRREVAAALARKPFAAMRADAESRVLTRDFVGAMRAKLAAGRMAVIAEIKNRLVAAGCQQLSTFFHPVPVGIHQSQRIAQLPVGRLRQ